MTQFSKAHWEADAKNVRMDIEFSKVNKEKRLVHGWATLDNLDTQGDIVLSEASVKAFSRARGNLREMHKKDDAVGKIVSFKEDTFRTPDGKVHKGIFVTAYVSKGAPNTWEKVLDGTLSGFSIGGSIIEAEEDFNKDAGTTVRIIKDYELTELSLVDNPGNQLANVFSIEKSAGGSVTVKGMAAETKITNVLYCDTDAIISEKEEAAAECPVCDNKMKNIGWFESGEDDSSEKVNELVTKYLTPDADAAISKGGDEVAKKDEENTTDESVETGHEAGDPLEIPTPTPDAEEADGTGVGGEVVDEVPEEETVEKAEAVEEVPDEQEEIAKKINELKDVVEKTLDSTRSETRKQIQELEEKIDTLTKSFTEKSSEFDGKFAELDEKFEVAKSRLAGFEKSLDRINAQGALKKSVDFDEPTVDEQNDDPWQGSAFSVRGLVN